jgi:protein disulfide-isomerase
MNMRRMMGIMAAATVAVAGLVAMAGEGGAWLTDFEAAKRQAAELNRPILADFSGSDWCGWCIKLDKEVFSKKAFQDYAGTNLVLFLADYPARKPQTDAMKAQNKALAAKYGIEGYPTVLLLDAKGAELARTGYQPGGPEAYVEHLKGLLKKDGAKKE